MALKDWTQRGLERLGLYHRLKGSSVYDWYWAVRDRTPLEVRAQEVDFYRDLLTGFSKGELIFDVGANQGSKTDVFLRLGARVVAVDPDELNQRILRERFLALRIVSRPVVIEGVAVSHECGFGTFLVDAAGSAKNTLSPKWASTLRSDDKRFGRRLEFPEQRTVATVTLDELIRRHGLPFFIKIDVEGFEAEVLRGLHAVVPCVSFEVNLPEFRAEGVQCIRLLRDLSPGGAFNYAPSIRTGWASSGWLGADEFEAVFCRCADESIEVFWSSTTR